MADDYSGNTSTTGTVSIGGSTTGAIEISGDTDWFRITLTAGQSYTFRLNAAVTGGLGDPYLELYDAGATLLASNDDGGGNLNSAITFKASTSGTYYLGARAFSTQTGNYIVSAVVDDYAGNTFTTGTVGIAGTTTGNIETSGDTDWFRVTLTAGVTYQFHLDAARISGLADPYLELRDSSGIFITFDDDSDGNLNSLITFTASASGTYYLDAHAFSTGTGDYVVSADVQGGETFTSTTSGIALTGTPQNPATIAAGALITNTAGSFQGDAVYGNTVAAWQITNYGTVSATDTASSGMDLRAGGNVVNVAGGQIAGAENGIFITGGTAFISNSGTIRGTGPLAYGVSLSSGGSISNAQNALIAGSYGGVSVSNATFSTVSNLGAITGTSFGVAFSNGVIINGAPNATSAQISAEGDGVLVLGFGEVTNYGNIKGVGTNGNGIELAGGGGVFNNISGLIAGGNNGAVIDFDAGKIRNSGTVQGTEKYSSGVYLRQGGFVANYEKGLLTGDLSGVFIGNGGGFVTNYGTIQGTGTYLSAAVFLTETGTVVNQGNGLIVGSLDGVNIGGSHVGGGTVFNSGTIQATGALGGLIGVAVSLTEGRVVNYGNALITGLTFGVDIQDPDNTAVINFGIIEGTANTSSGIILSGGKVFNKNTGIIRGSDGVRIASTEGFVANYGLVLATATNGVGISLTSGNVSNFGTVRAGTDGTGVYLANGNIANYGTIIAPGSSGIAVSVGNGTFFNQGLVQGRVSGIQFSAIAGTIASGKVTVSGSVVGATGISVTSGTASQTVTVAGTVTGTSGTAVSLTKAGSDRLILAPGAVFQGKVDGGGGKSVVEVAVSAGMGSAGLGETAVAPVYVGLGSVTNFSALQVDQGVMTDADGNLSFGTLVNQGQINLLAGDSLVVGTVAGAATGGTIDLKSGGSVHFTGAVAASQTVLFRPPGGSVAIDHPEQFAAAITQFAASDVIDLPLGVASFQQYAGGVLSLNYGSGTVALQLTTTAVTPQFQFTPDGHGGTDILVSDVCFCRGTLILAERGEVAVEDLAVGERVRTLAGALKPIRWIGTGSAPLGRGNRLARPVIVRRGALAEGVPSRDLHLTHGHALYLEGVLIPVENLVNHHSILWDESALRVEYYHIELADHDVLLANGAPAESYYDADNRAQFDNTRPGSAPGEATPGFAPVLSGGEIVERVWAALLARAGGRAPSGSQGETTDDPDLHLLVNDLRLDPPAVDGTAYRFTLPGPPVAPLRLCSRSGVPSLLGITAHDHRRLGVAISRIVYGQRGVTTTLLHNVPLLQQGGCHPPEAAFSWTDGELELPARLFAHMRGPFTLTVHTERPGGMRYPLEGEGRQAA